MKKRNRYLTVIVVPHHKGRQRSYHLSSSLIKWLAVAGCLLALAVLALVVSYGKIYWRAGQYELMRKQHALMEDEFAKLQQIKEELSRLRSEEAKVRQMLGVPRQPDTLAVAEIARSAPNREPPPSPPERDGHGGQMPVMMPTRGWISSGFSAQHQGVDIAARQGQPVLATADGMVEFAGWDYYFGRKVVLRHGERHATVYGHCEKLLVLQGQPVRRGQVIALVGSSGKSTGPHLHYEIHLDGKIVDPVNYWIAR